MSDFIEIGLRAIEDQYVLSPEGRQAITQIRATMYNAQVEGHFPKTVEVDSHQAPSIYIHPEFDFHRDLGLIIIGERRESLTPSESRVFNELVGNPNVMIPYARLQRLFRGAAIDFEPDPTVSRVHISRIRNKLNPNYGINRSSPIITVRNNGFGSGYMLVDPSRAPFVTPPVPEESPSEIG